MRGHWPSRVVESDLLPSLVPTSCSHILSTLIGPIFVRFIHLFHHGVFTGFATKPAGESHPRGSSFRYYGFEGGRGGDDLGSYSLKTGHE